MAPSALCFPPPTVLQTNSALEKSTALSFALIGLHGFINGTLF